VRRAEAAVVRSVARCGGRWRCCRRPVAVRCVNGGWGWGPAPLAVGVTRTRCSPWHGTPWRSV